MHVAEMPQRCTIGCMEMGLYIAVFLLTRQRRLRIGALGSFTFQAGVYLYVGSAQRNLTARIERHGRRDKPLRWHIDYLSAKARMLGAILVPGSRRRECQLARKVADLHPRIVAGFGSSDCGCEGHLFYAGSAIECAE
jgi:sugar fermentation stimulation protein A